MRDPSFFFTKIMGEFQGLEKCLIIPSLNICSVSCFNSPFDASGIRSFQLVIPLQGSTLGVGITCSTALAVVSLSPARWNMSLNSSHILSTELLSSLFRWSVLSLLLSSRILSSTAIPFGAFRVHMFIVRVSQYSKFIGGKATFISVSFMFTTLVRQVPSRTTVSDLPMITPGQSPCGLLPRFLVLYFFGSLMIVSLLGFRTTSFPLSGGLASLSLSNFNTTFPIVTSVFR